MIETERLILRPFIESDANDVFEYLNKPSVNCFDGMKLKSLEEAKQLIRKRKDSDEYCFAIVLKDLGKVIGEIEAYSESSNHDDNNLTQDTYSPCWMLNINFQGKGYAYEAVRAFFDYLFKDKGARRIYAYTEEDNFASQKLCEKLGMRKEGLFVEFVTFVKNHDGTPKYENTVQYAILNKEWNMKK